MRLWSSEAICVFAVIRFTSVLADRSWGFLLSVSTLLLLLERQKTLFPIHYEACDISPIHHWGGPQEQPQRAQKRPDQNEMDDACSLGGFFPRFPSHFDCWGAISGELAIIDWEPFFLANNRRLLYVEHPSQSSDNRSAAAAAGKIESSAATISWWP